MARSDMSKTRSPGVTVLLVALVCVAPTTQQVCDQTLVNNVVDFVIEQMVSKFPDSVPLQNVTSSFSVGNLELTDGRLNGISSVRRTGNFQLTMDDSMRVSLVVGLRDLVITYEQFYVKALGVPLSGRLTATIGEVDVYIGATMENKSLCFLYIDTIEFLKLKDFNVDLGKKSASWAVTKVVNLLKADIKHLIESKVDEVLIRILNPADQSMVCKKKNN